MALVLAIYVAFMVLHWRDLNNDYTLFFLPWMESLRDNGLLETLALRVPNYTAPFVMYQSVFTSLFPNGDILILAKAAGGVLLVIFALCGALAFKSIEHQRVAFPLIFGWMVLAPTAGLNAIIWTQADTLITAFLFLSFAALQRGWLWAAMVLFAVALSTKLISIFFAPYLLFCLMQRRAFRHIIAFGPVVVGTYFVVNLPYLLAGVSVSDTLAIYRDQAEFFTQFSMNAPNPWHVAQLLKLLPEPATPAAHLLSLIGIGFAALVGVGVVAAGWVIPRLPRHKELALLSLILILFPYILPKMHDRYFFMADSFTWMAAAMFLRFLPVAILLQLAGWLASAPFLQSVQLYVLKDAFGPPIGAVLMGLAILILLSILFGRDRALGSP